MASNRWVLDKGCAKIQRAENTFAGSIGSCIDIPERKLAEEGLATIGRRLIEAQEEERAWIGRELHDDINQRLALLAVELDPVETAGPLDARVQGAYPPRPGTYLADCHRRKAYPIVYIPRSYGISGFCHRCHHSFCRELSRNRTRSKYSSDMREFWPKSAQGSLALSVYVFCRRRCKTL